MRLSVALLFVVLAAPIAFAQQHSAEPGSAALPEAKPTSTAAQVRSEFHVRYVNGSNVYIDAGRDAGLAEGTALVLKQNTSISATDAQNAAVEPGVIAKLQVVAVASNSAVCEVKSTTRDIAPGDTLSLPDAEVEKLSSRTHLATRANIQWSSALLRAIRSMKKYAKSCHGHRCLRSIRFAAELVSTLALSSS